MIYIKIFNEDSLFVKIFELIADIFLLNILWILFTILGLGLTMGSSTTAAYYVAKNRISNRYCNIIELFIYSFKQNVKQTILINFLQILLLGIGILSIISTVKFNIFDEFNSIVVIIQIIAIFQICIFFTYIYILISILKINVLNLIKSAFLLTNKYFATSIFMFFILCFAIFMIIYIPISILIVIGIYIFITSYITTKIIEKHIKHTLK